MKYLSLIYICLFIIGCGTMDKKSHNEEIETFSVLNNGMYQSSIETNKRASSTILYNGLRRDALKHCMGEDKLLFIVSSEVTKINDLYNIVLTYKCIDNLYSMRGN